jgi:polyferredoxin
VFVLLLAGNFFCLACPFMLVRNLARKFFRPVRNWPRRLRNKWLSLGLFVTMLFVYEWLDLWASPWWTAWLIIAYFAGRAADRRDFQTRDVLQIRLSDRAVQFCRFNCFAA